MPSNDNDGITDEQQAIADAKLVLEDSDSTEEERTTAQEVVNADKEANKSEEDKKAEEEAEKQKQEAREKSHKDLLKSEFTKVANEEKKIEDVAEWLRDEVNEKIQKLAPETKQTDEDKIVERVRVETQLESDKELLSDDEAKELQETYEDFKEHGYPLPEARSKAKKQLGILSPADKERQEQLSGMRTVPTDGSSTSQSTEMRKLEKEYDDSLPQYIKDARKNSKKSNS